MKLRVKVSPPRSNTDSSRPKLKQMLLQLKMLLSRTDSNLGRQPLKMHTSNSSKDMDLITTIKAIATIALHLLMTAGSTTSTLIAVTTLTSILGPLKARK